MPSARFWPVIRGALAASPRCSMRPYGNPFHKPWNNMARMDRQILSMQREMDKMFDNLGRSDSWFNSANYPMIDSPFSDSTITESTDGKKQINYHFDVHSFKPEEIQIKTTDGKTLEVRALRDEQKDGKTLVKRSFHQIVLIPETVKPDELKSVLSPEGVLTISAPLNEPVEEVEKADQLRIEDVNLDIKHE